MYDELKELHRCPEVFSVYTADVLWTRPHLAERMLRMHLDPETALASRPVAAIERVVAWLDDRFRLDGKAVSDLGCGPGLYAERFAGRGATVHGLDFSATAIAYAERQAEENGGAATYAIADYLVDPLPQDRDLVTMIYCDLCALSPARCRRLLCKVRESLKPGGSFVFDVVSTRAFEAFSEHRTFGRGYMDGFWSANDYFAYHNAWRYEAEAVSLDRFTIVEERDTWEVFNWMRYFTPESIAAELRACGFGRVEIVGGFGMDAADDTTFGVIAGPVR